MHKISLDDAIRRLPQLVDEATRGEDVILTQNDQPVARLVALHPSRPTTVRRVAGTAKGMGYMSPDFDEPIEDFNEYMR